jgi:hypothetical protein
MADSRQLDAEVAALMGWQPISWRTEGEETDLWGYHPDSPVARVLPHYSSDIAAAWAVVEKMAEIYGKGVWIQVALTDGLDSEGPWICQLSYTGGPMIAEQGAETAPQAICKAAAWAAKKGEAK